MQFFLFDALWLSQISAHSLQGNKITEIGPEFSKLRQLRQLRLDQNAISKMGKRGGKHSRRGEESEERTRMRRASTCRSC